MFDLFGEMDTFEEINRTAEGLFNEEDMDNLKKLAEENGIDSDITELYIAGEIPELCDLMTAAVGKLTVEKKDPAVAKYNSKIPADPIIEYLSGECAKEKMAAAIRKKGKSLAKCLEHIEKEARKIVTKERPWLHDAAVYKMAKDYYLQEDKA